MSPRAPASVASAVLAAALAAVLAAVPAAGHFIITMSCRVLVNFDGGAVDAIGQSWTFDPAYSRQVLADFDANGDGSFDAGEVATIRLTGLPRLADSDYFTAVSLDGRPLGRLVPYTFNAVARGGLVTFTLSMRLPAPVAIAGHTLTVALRDPADTIVPVFADADPVVLRGAGGAACTGRIDAGKAPGTAAVSVVCPPA